MKKIDLLVVTLFPLLIFTLITFMGWHLRYIISLLLFFGIPSLYLSLKNKEKIKKVASFTAQISIPISIIFLVINHSNKSWILLDSILPYRFLGAAALEDFIWTFLTLYSILIFYEHFCNKRFTAETSIKIRVMNSIFYSLAGLVILLFLTDSTILSFPYAYLLLGTFIYLIPLFLFFTKFPSYIENAFKTSLFFFYLHLLYEIIGLKLGYWIFPGTTYIGWISFFDISFPLEEFFFVLVIGGFAGTAFYEFFTNDKLEES